MVPFFLHLPPLTKICTTPTQHKSTTYIILSTDYQPLFLSLAIMGWAWVKVTDEDKAMLDAAYKHIIDHDFDLGNVHKRNACVDSLRVHYPKLGLVKPPLMENKQWDRVVDYHICARLQGDAVTLFDLLGGGGGGGGGGDGSNSCNNVSSDAAYLQHCRDYIASIESENRVLRQEVKSNDDEIKSIKLSLTGKENEIKQLQKEHTVALKDAEDAANKVIKSNEDKKRTEIKQLQEKHTVALKDAQETLNAKELENAALTEETELTKEANTNAFNELEASHKVTLDSAENRRVIELKLVEDNHEVEIDLCNVKIDELQSHVNIFINAAKTVATAGDKKIKGKT